MSAAALEAIEHLFSYTNANVWLSSLLNDKNADRIKPKHCSTHHVSEVAEFVRDWDLVKRGLFFCVSTIRVGAQRLKENVAEIPTLWADIDLKDIDDKQDDVVRKLQQLRLPPSRMHFSGNGVHAFWKLKEPALFSDIERVEAAVKLLADLVGGDQKVTQVAALMRLPGSHNSKGGEWKLVETLDSNDHEYELDELEDWLAETAPVILRKDRPNQYVEDNPFAEYAKKFGFKMPVDVEKRLAGMMYMGGGDASIHTTQVSVTASLLEQGKDYEVIVKMVLEATRTAAGEYGKRWNWKREERNLRRMCDTWLKKHPKEEKEGKKSTGNGDGDVVSLAAKRAEREKRSKEQEREQDQEQNGPRVRTKKKPPHVVIAESLLGVMHENGQRALFNNEQLWIYDKGIWREINKTFDWLDGKIEQCIRALNQHSTTKLVSEVRNYIFRHPDVLTPGDIPWDMHGKISVREGLLDPITLQFEPAKPEDLITTRIEVDYDPNAKCPWWLQMLGDCFGDRTADVRAATIGVIQEILGAALIERKDRSLRKAVVFVGPSWCGKSDLLNVLRGLLTDHPNATALSALNQTHGLQQFAHNGPWVLHEAFDHGQWVFPGMAKAILTGDPVQINVKNGPITSKEITSPVFWASNYPPQFKEATRAIVNRMVIIQCNTVFEEGKRIGAAAEAYAKGFVSPSAFILATEKAGLLNWALVGLRRLMERGSFAPTEETREAGEAVRRDSNIVAGFISECCTFGESFMIGVPDFCAAFTVWWQENKGEDRHVPSNDSIGRALVALGEPRIGIDNQNLRDSKRRYYAGLHLNDIGLDYWNGAASEGLAKGKTARISSAAIEVNQTIRADWRDLEVINRLRKAFRRSHATRQGEEAGEEAGSTKIRDTSPRF